MLDWLLHAFALAAAADVQFVGGYQIEAISERYPALRYVENPEWENTGAAGSLFRAAIPEHWALFVSYSDILYRQEAVNALDTVGGDELADLRCENLSGLVERLRLRGIDVRGADLSSDWAERNESRDRRPE